MITYYISNIYTLIYYLTDKEEFRYGSYKSRYSWYGRADHYIL